MRTKNPKYLKMIEELIDDYMEKNDASPTVREIHAGIGLAVGTVSRYLSFMHDNGMIDYEGCRNITTREAKITRAETTKSIRYNTQICVVTVNPITGNLIQTNSK